MKILGIETSCDETSVAITKHRKVLSNTTISQLIHSDYGGVVPEIASREHLSLINEVAEKSIKDSSLNLNEIDYIAVTNGPGLKGALMVGVNFAKGLSVANNIPLIGVNHMEGHLFSNFIDKDKVTYPFICMLVSGGHTQIWGVQSYRKYELFSNTVDDAAGEAFDKGARMLGLGYPGGPEIENLSKSGNLGKFNFPIPEVKKSKFNFSFSGLKTSLFYMLKNQNISKDDYKNIACDYQEAILDSLIKKLMLVSEETGFNDIVISGGVTANLRFREKLDKITKNGLYNIDYPPIKYCTDNAAMICIAGYEKVINNNFFESGFDIHPSLMMDQ